MSEIIYKQIDQAILSGRTIQAIKLIRQLENLNLSEAKARIDSIAVKLRGDKRGKQYSEEKSDREILEASSRPRAHGHAPARSGTYNVEADLSTEAFLFLQKGEVGKGLKLIQEHKGINKTSAKRMAKLFYQQHPEYTSAEIIQLMSTGGVVANASTSQTDTTSSSSNSIAKKRKDSGSIFKGIIFFIILINIIKAFVD